MLYLITYLIFKCRFQKRDCILNTTQSGLLYIIYWPELSPADSVLCSPFIWRTTANARLIFIFTYAWRRNIVRSMKISYCNKYSIKAKLNDIISKLWVQRDLMLLYVTLLFQLSYPVFKWCYNYEKIICIWSWGEKSKSTICIPLIFH